jgi:hypothetical protein
VIAVGERILSYAELDVYRAAFDAAMEIFELSKSVPKGGTFLVAGSVWSIIAVGATFERVLASVVGMISHRKSWVSPSLLSHPLLSNLVIPFPRTYR